MGVTRVVAIDPGRDKCGVAVVDAGQGTLHRQVAPTQQLLSIAQELLSRYECRTIVLGDQTSSAVARQSLQPLLDQNKIDDIIFIDEHGSTETARSRYWQACPPTGWRCLIPRGLLVPPCAIDDFAAIILAERYFKKIF